MKEDNHNSDYSNEDDLKSAETILSYALISYQRYVNQFEKLDTKAATIAGFTGIIITISTGLIGALSPTKSQISSEQFPKFLIIIFLFLLISLFVSFAFSISSIAVRRFKDISSISNVLKNFKTIERNKYRRRRLIKRIILNISKAEDSIIKKTTKKAKHLKRATFFLFISLAFGISFIFIFLNYKFKIL